MFGFALCTKCQAREVQVNQAFNRMILSQWFLIYLVLAAICTIWIGMTFGTGYSLLFVGVAIPSAIFFTMYRVTRRSY